MNNKAILITISVVAILLASVIKVSNVYAESNTKRYNDGYSNGSEAAARDSTYNVACDPTGAHTSDGQHSTTYCTCAGLMDTQQLGTLTMEDKQHRNLQVVPYIQV